MTEAELATADAPGTDAAGAAPFERVADRVGRRWGELVERIGTEPMLAVQAVISFAAVVLGTALVLATLHPSELLKDTTTTGGDMGSHLWGPRYLIDHLLPQLRLSGWTPDWYSGFPAYQFYMVIPSLMVVAVHVGLPWWAAIPVLAATAALVFAAWDRERLFRYRWAAVVLGGAVALLVVGVPYNLAFKWVTVAGLVGLPIACWFLARAARLPFPVPPLAAVAGTLFIFNQNPLYNNTGNIIGGNFQSTMAGEFAFSISLTLAVLYLGVAIAGLRTGRYRALAALLFALAGLSHLIPAFFVLGCTVALLVVQPDRSRIR
ncbi:MAG: hypothetical protein KDA98_01510, partial [Acidimicrobiales bacterium]|nr:hypothetical protein [Acidimicrobiales bacterium]